MAFAEKAELWAKQYDNVKVEIIDYEAAKRHGMGGLVAVGMGSSRKPCMVIFTLNGDQKGRHPMLVGKASPLTRRNFAQARRQHGRDEYDMGGSATVGTMEALASSGLPPAGRRHHLHGRKHARSQCSTPRDVITTLSGKTIEVLNTDAEGRLVFRRPVEGRDRLRPRVHC
ncbi:MAG: hypothetical protein CM15mP78_13830 [Candidatus Poseidoniales archaeon]|nr:MAG: hypothetical protein CM15mP78_13830 [Candidatus Poseidoniales archaeon]